MPPPNPMQAADRARYGAFIKEAGIKVE